MIYFLTFKDLNTHTSMIYIKWKFAYYQIIKIPEKITYKTVLTLGGLRCIWVNEQPYFFCQLNDKRKIR